MVDLDAFLLGMKPALFGNTGSPTMMNNMDKLVHYPYITKGIDLFDREDFFLFFQNDEQKRDFLTKLKTVVPRSPEFHELLGLTLGYPPAAVRFYTACKTQPHLSAYRLAIRYAGIRCVSHVDDLTENATWLWNRYTEDEDMKILIGTHFHPVKRFDIERLNEIKNIMDETIAI